MATLPSELFKHQHNIVPSSYCINGVYEGGLLVFNSCSALDLMHSNKSHVDKSEDMPKILTGFGASAHYFSQANSGGTGDKGKQQRSDKRYLKALFKGGNDKFLDKLLRNVAFDRI